METWTERRRWWFFGWHEKEVRIWRYTFILLQVWMWGPYHRWSGCAVNRRRYSWSQGGFGFGSYTYYNAVITWETDVTAQAPFADEGPC